MRGAGWTKFWRASERWGLSATTGGAERCGLSATTGGAERTGDEFTNWAGSRKFAGDDGCWAIGDGDPLPLTVGRTGEGAATGAGEGFIPTGGE